MANKAHKQQLFSIQQEGKPKKVDFLSANEVIIADHFNYSLNVGKSHLAVLKCVLSKQPQTDTFC